ncbi:MAG: GNAT family N-acetyltransferase [Saprospiraceae bacterium]|nr:GNAT family N-acetyltransferase [Saprospiraceae bacterium]
MIMIRPLNEYDKKVYRMTRLECLQAYPERFGSEYEEEVLKPELYFEKCLSDKDSPNFIFGAFDGENCVGLCGFVRENSARTKHRGEIVQMYVHPDYQGRGIGKQLLQNVIHKAFENEAIEQIVLGVFSSNVSANKVYEQLGFVEYGFQPNYFKIGKDYLHQRLMILMRK